MQYTEQEIIDYLKSNLPDKWSDEICNYIDSNNIRINFGILFELFMNNEDEISELIGKSANNFIKVFTHVDNLNPIIKYMSYLNKKSNTIEKLISNMNCKVNYDLITICNSMKQKPTHEDKTIQPALNLTHQNPLVMKDKSIARLVNMSSLDSYNDYLDALKIISPKELVELYIESHSFDNMCDTFLIIARESLGDEKISYRCFINHFDEFDYAKARINCDRIKWLFERVDNPKALYKYLIIDKFCHIDTSYTNNFIKWFCDITNIEPDNYLYKNIARDETERTKKALELSADHYLVRDYLIFEDFVLDDIDVKSDKWDELFKFANLVTIAHLYITSHMPSKFDERIINYFCDRLKNVRIDPSCLSSQYLIFGTKIIKEWANAPEIAKKIMKFIDFDIKSPIRKGIDEKYN